MIKPHDCSEGHDRTFGLRTATRRSECIKRAFNRVAQVSYGKSGYTGSGLEHSRYSTVNDCAIYGHACETDRPRLIGVHLQE